jgi:hypothetical protein
MRETTEKLISKVRETYVDMAYSSIQMPQTLKDEIDRFHQERVKEGLDIMAEEDAKKFENTLARLLKGDALLTIVTLCISTRSMLDSLIVKKLMKEMALSDLAESEPKGHA